MKKVFIFLGPPGSGKGTQTSRLADKLSVPHVDTGSLLRKNIQDETELGIIAKGFIDKGQLVPLHVVSAVIKDRIQKDDCKDGYILDGFPRSVEQADELKKIMSEVGTFDLKEDALAIYFDIDNEVLIQRLINRRSCPKCGTIYNLISNPPKIMDYCDICDTKLTIRKDDNEETARLRFETYEKETAPLYDYFKQLGILKELDADKPITEIWENLKEIVFDE
ncbi:MAG: adenylate kinase [Candidatus Gastranaerophilales bacterium]|nr:adenylate kinase [Candidatus Gastranaerophilales bacterium]MCR4881675.1 adenylate kinase [bacterium]